MYRSLTLLTICYIVNLTTAGKFPSNLERCNAGDTDCLVRVINLYARLLKDGRSDLHIVPLDPLHVDQVDIIQGNDSPVSVNINFKDVLLSGLSDMNVTKVVGFGKDPRTSKYEIYASIPKIAIIGKYKVKGNVILLPIVGNGPANLTLNNVDFVLKFIPKFETKDGKEHLKFADVKVDFTTTRLHMHLSNLFNGDKTLSRKINQFLNENWLIILNELKPALRKVIVKIVLDLIDPFFDEFPHSEIFLE